MIESYNCDNRNEEISLLRTEKTSSSRNIALLMAYDGTSYSGWQRQRKDVTVQGTIEKALSSITGERLSLYGCSRTDAGVHALGHVSNFHTKCKIPTEKIPIALATKLPSDISCLAATEVDKDFQARFRARAKQYSYYIQLGASVLPQLRRYSYHEARTLDLAKMTEAAKLLVGSHDFSAFQAAGSPSSSNIRRLYTIAISLGNRQIFNLVERADECTETAALLSAKAPVRSVSNEELLNPCSALPYSSNLLRIVVHGSGFLYNMMRILAGTLLYVGLAKISLEQVQEAIELGDRNLSGKTLPACGLFLDSVDYDSWLWKGTEYRYEVE